MADKNVVSLLITAKDSATSVFTSMQAKVAAVGVAIAGYFGINAFVGAVKGAGDLEAAMSRIAAATGASAGEMAQLKKAADDAGTSTKFTATETANALETLVKNGLSAKDAIGSLPAVLNLAQAGGVDLASAADYVTKAVKGMGLSFDDAGRVADVLAMGANASSTSVSALAEALSYTAPVAKSAGLSLESTVAIIGKFADSGIDASRAGTGLNEILSQFIDPASKFRQELAAMGIVTGDFNSALKQLTESGAKGEKAILAVGLSAGPALRSLTNQGTAALAELKDKLDNASGSAAEAAKVMGANLNGAVGQLGSTWTSLKNKLAEPVLPILTAGIKDLTNSFRAALADGTIGKFGDTIATAFKSGITWIKAFAAEFDFAALTARLQIFATRTSEAFERIALYATNAGNTVQLVYGIMSAGTHAVLAVVYGVGEAFAGVLSNIQSGLALLYDGLSKITFGSVSAAYQALASDIRTSAAATWAASEALSQKSTESFGKMTDSAVIARKAYAGLSADTQTLASAHTTSANAIEGVATQLKALGDAAPTAAQKQIEAHAKTRESIATLKAEYAAAMAAGDIQLAAQKQQQLRDELKKTGSQANQTGEEIKKALESGFKELGIVSQAELKKSAEAAQNIFKTMKESGQATAMDLANAFKVVAERTLAAAGPIGSVAREMAESTLVAKAAAEGLVLEVDNGGKVIVQRMGDAANATNGLGSAADGAANSFDRLAAAKDRAAAAGGGGGGGGGGSSNSGAGGSDLPGGSTLKKDNMRGVDNTGLFDLEQKRSAGTLGKSDLAQAEAVYRAAMVNVDVFQKNQAAFSTEGAKSIMDTAAKAKALLDQVKSFEVGGRAPAAAPIAAAPTPAPTPAPSPSPTPAAPAPSPTAPVAGTATPSAVSGASDAALVRLTNSINNLDYTINQFASQLSRAAPSSAGNDWLSNLAKAKANSGL